MIAEAEKGNLKALYIMGENPLHSLPQSERVQKALGNLDFMVVQDILYTPTAKMADVVLPGAAFSEKEGSFTNLEGRIQSFARAAQPPGEAKPDWEILNLLAAKTGKAKSYDAIAKLINEVRRLVPAYADLKDNGQSWIKETSAKTLFNAGTTDALISFAPLVSSEDEGHDETYPYTAILGSYRYHLGAGTRTGTSERISNFGIAAVIEISPEDGRHLGLEDGDSVKVFSEYGTITRKIKSATTVTKGQLFIPLALNANDAMNLVGLEALTAPESPGWKTVQVRLEKA